MPPFFFLTAILCRLEPNSKGCLPINSSRGDKSVLILKQYHSDTLQGVLQV